MSEKQSTSVMRNIRPLLQMILETVLPLGLFAAKLYALNADILKLGTIFCRCSAARWFWSACCVF